MDNLVTELQNTCASYRYIVFGELHGVRQNVEILERFIREKVPCLRAGIGLAFEWPLNKAECNKLNEYISGVLTEEDIKDVLKKLYSQQSGVFSDQHLRLLRMMREQNTPDGNGIKKLIAFDPDTDSWNERDRDMARTIMEEGAELDVVIIVTGDLHARKQQFTRNGSTEVLIPLASYLPKDNTYAMKVRYQTGSFFNFGVRLLQQSAENAEGSQYYDAVHTLPKADPINLND